MQQINQNYGAFRRVESSKVEVAMSAPVEIRAVYDSVFEKGRATEWFVFVIEGNDIRLRTYFVSPLKGGSPPSTSQRTPQPKESFCATKNLVVGDKSDS
jgi:hypothetical protein